jgi:uncharacterized membrane protein YphA (DoxX/SURF4 family)
MKTSPGTHELSNASRRIARGAGAVFLAAGGLKFFKLGVFISLLTQMRVPFPALLGVLVPLLEVCGGVGLMARRGVRMSAGLLALDMAGALVLVGLPHRARRVGEYSVGGEAWRTPLEIVLLLAMLWLIFSEQKTAEREA